MDWGLIITNALRAAIGLDTVIFALAAIGEADRLLWAARCRSAGVEVSWGGFALRGLVLVPVLLVTATLALAFL